MLNNKWILIKTVFGSDPILYKVSVTKEVMFIFNTTPCRKSNACEN